MLNSFVYSALVSRTILNNGMMFASFHSKGSIASSKDKLNNVANGMLICSTLSSSSLGGIPFTSGDLLFFLSRIFYATMFRGTISCPKQSDCLSGRPLSLLLALN